MNKNAVGAFAVDMLKQRAAELRKSQPHLTEAQAFAKVYVDPANRDLAKIERAMNRPGYPPIARTEPVVGATDGLAELQKLSAELRARHPFLSAAQAFSRVYQDPANRGLVALERSQNRPAA